MHSNNTTMITTLKAERDNLDGGLDEARSKLAELEAMELFLWDKWGFALVRARSSEEAKETLRDQVVNWWRHNRACREKPDLEWLRQFISVAPLQPPSGQTHVLHYKPDLHRRDMGDQPSPDLGQPRDMGKYTDDELDQQAQRWANIYMQSVGEPTELSTTDTGLLFLDVDDS